MSSIPAQIERFVQADRGSLRIYLGFFGLTLLAGLALTAGGFITQTEAESVGGLFLKLGGAFVAVLGTFPLKECLSIRDRVRSLESMRLLWEEYSASENPQTEELQRVKDFVWKLYEKRGLS